MRLAFIESSIQIFLVDKSDSVFGLLGRFLEQVS